MKTYDVAVIGQGYAGLMAARLVQEKDLEVITFEQMFAGGFIMNVNHLDPAPEGKPTGGPDLVSGLAMENMDLGIETLNGAVTGLSEDSKGWRIRSDAGEALARHVVIASGTRPRRLGLAGEEALIGRGISECADCDGPMLAGQETIVVGGGDSAFQEALTLSMFGARVTLVLRSAPRARPDFVARAEADASITLMHNSTVRAIEQDAGGLTGVQVEGPNGSEQLLPCRALFVFVGQDPLVDFLPATVERDARGAIVTDAAGRASLPGLWAAGSVRSGFGGLLSDAEADARQVVGAID